MAKHRRRGSRKRSSTNAPPRLPTALSLPDDVVERALLTGDPRYAGLLDDRFGPALTAELRELARRASQARSRRGPGPRVLIVPGIQGSKLGAPRAFLGFDDVVWADPVDIMVGRLSELSLERSPVMHKPLGVFLFAYAKMKYRLIEDGFDAVYHPYDWRHSIDRLGRELFAHVRGLGEPVHIVAHSMGGLLARAAAALDKPAAHDRRVIRSVVQLGTPNNGSFLAVHALRGLSDFIKTLGRLDLTQSIEELTGRVFNTFPAVYQLLPHPDFSGNLDFFEPASYPPGGPALRSALMREALNVRHRLSAPDDRVTLIAGCNFRTCVHISRQVRAEGDGEEELVSEFTREGDGVVPLKLAEHADIQRTYYVEEEHGSLCNNREVARAVSDILARGRTDRLPTTPRVTVDRATVRLTESQMRSRGEEPTLADGMREGGIAIAPDLPLISAVGALRMFREFASPDSNDRETDGAPGMAIELRPGPVESGDEGGGAAGFKGVVVSRRAQRRLDVRIAHGSITAAYADALVLGTFEGVRPVGPATAIDLALDGALSEFVDRRMFASAVGEICIIPLGRRNLRAEHAVFVGLGPFDRFNADVQRFAAENVMRTCIRTGVDDFATVLFGAGSGTPPEESLRNILTGFVAELERSDERHAFRAVTLVEFDPQRFAQMREALYQLARTRLFERIAVTFDEESLPPGPEQEGAARRARAARAGGREACPLAEPVYLSVSVRQPVGGSGTLEVRSAALGAMKKSVTVSGVRSIRAGDLEKLKMDALEHSRRRRDAEIRRLGERLVRDLLDPNVVAMVASHAAAGARAHPIVLTLDADASSLPWEAIHLPPPAEPAASALDPRSCMTRSLVADNLSVAKYLDQRREDDRFTLLVVQNPTEDLAGADAECEALVEQLESHGATLTVLRHGEATRRRVLEEFGSGRYDAIHYAGHAWFDAASPQRGGLLCSGREVVTGGDLATLRWLPALVFLNACESAVVQRGGGRRTRVIAPQSDTRRDLLRESESRRGVCEALLRAGVANVLGTYWPVGDSSAAEFAGVFYRAMIGDRSGREPVPIGVALTRARMAVSKLRGADKVDWAGYMLYGDPCFMLKLTGP